MEQGYPDISDDLRLTLQERGLKPYQQKPIPDFLNPHSTYYWQTNILMMGLCWYGRQRATKSGGPRIFWSTALLSIPYYALMSKGKLDSQDEILGQRKTLEDRLEYSPITRRAWDRALEINTDYQNQLKQEIFELEQQVFQRQQQN